MRSTAWMASLLAAVVASCGGGPSATPAPTMAEPEPNPRSEPMLFEREFDYDGGRRRQVASLSDGGVGDIGAVQDAEPSGPGEREPLIEPEPGAAIALGVAVQRIAYDAAAHEAHALSTTASELLRIDLAAGEVSRRLALPFVPSDLCLDSETDRLFVAEAGGGAIVEYELSSYMQLRELPWDAPAWSGFSRLSDAHYHVRCAGDVLYAVDAQWTPGLWRIPLAEGEGPEDLSASVREVGSLVLTHDYSELYYVRQFGWSAGNLASDIFRVSAQDLSQLDTTGIDSEEFPRDPLDAPLVYDEEAALIGAKHLLFDARDLSRRVHEFSAGENILAIDGRGGVVATDLQLYRLADFSPLRAAAVPGARVAMFDRDGVLYLMSNMRQALYVQDVAP